MLQAQSHLYIKDNSASMAGRCINTHGKPWCAVGDTCTVAITKAKKALGLKTNKVSKTQQLLILQTKKAFRRPDGSFVKFSANAAAVYNITKKTSSTLGFKRINTSVAFELKKTNKKIFSGKNLIKLAKKVI